MNPASSLFAAAALHLGLLSVPVRAETAAPAPSATASAAAEATVTRLSGGAPTLDELVGRFATALSENDRAALEALRVTQAEYRDLIVPGNVKPGEPPQIVGAEASEYFFGVMNTKSAYYRDALLKSYAGKKLSIREVRFEKGVQQYAGHRAHKRLLLTVVDETGATHEIRTGSIVERDGVFKLMSFIRD
ncbi:MAG: hypothetical protein FJ144_12875 [Deltaproteobacteria bacterium]|nr:hypothetical protein [Deltaproteobacteria bacterium]